MPTRAPFVGMPFGRRCSGVTKSAVSPTRLFTSAVGCSSRIVRRNRVPSYFSCWPRPSNQTTKMSP